MEQITQENGNNMDYITQQNEKGVKRESPMKNGERTGKNLTTGRFEVGNTYGEGMPVGYRHMTTILTEAIKKVAEGTATPEDVAIVKKLIELAKLGDMRAIELVFNYLDGKPPTAIDLTTKGEKIGESRIPPELIKEFEDKLIVKLME